MMEAPKISFCILMGLTHKNSIMIEYGFCLGFSKLILSLHGGNWLDPLRRCTPHSRLARYTTQFPTKFKRLGIGVARAFNFSCGAWTARIAGCFKNLGAAELII